MVKLKDGTAFCMSLKGLKKDSHGYVVFVKENDAAKNQTITPKVVDGDYRVELTIGDKVFIDEMTLKGKEKPMELSEFQGEFVGIMIVPGAFTSPITGSRYCTSRDQLCALNFSIVVNENGQSYKVNYTAKVDAQNYNKYQSDTGPLIITGTATLEDSSVLGEYTATKL